MNVCMNVCMYECMYECLYECMYAWVTCIDCDGFRRKFEIPEMCYMFLGKRGIESYTLCATLYLYGTLWAYSSVIGKAFSTYAVFSGSLYFNYVIYLGFFAVLVSLFEFHLLRMYRLLHSCLRMYVCMYCTVDIFGSTYCWLT
jgi:hypothetical protein